jgi:DNA repair exonuclease SbcCD ATPase subunit
MTGGYREQHRSRLGAMQKLKQAQEKLDDLEDKFDKVKAQLSEMDQRITMVTGEAERIELNRKQDVETYKSFKVRSSLLSFPPPPPSPFAFASIATRGSCAR